MDEKFEGKPVVRDIEICKKCGHFKRVNDPAEGKRGWHWGVGVYCNNFPKGVVCGWCKETLHAVTEEEFVRATKIWANKNNCPQCNK